MLVNDVEPESYISNQSVHILSLIIPKGLWLEVTIGHCNGGEANFNPGSENAGLL